MHEYICVNNTLGIKTCYFTILHLTDCFNINSWASLDCKGRYDLILPMLDYQMKDIQMDFDIPVNKLDYTIISPEYFKENLSYLSAYEPAEVKTEKIFVFYINTFCF